MAITDAFRGTSKRKLYNELGVEALLKRGWHTNLCCIFKIVKFFKTQYTTSFKILFSRLRLLNETKWYKTFAIQKI